MVASVRSPWMSHARHRRRCGHICGPAGDGGGEAVRYPPALGKAVWKRCGRCGQAAELIHVRPHWPSSYRSPVRQQCTAPTAHPHLWRTRAAQTASERGGGELPACRRLSPPSTAPMTIYYCFSSYLCVHERKTGSTAIAMSHITTVDRGLWKKHDSSVLMPMPE